MVELIKSETLYHHAFCVYLRTLVFIQEQGYSVSEEIYMDEDDATYFLMLDQGDIPVASGRFRELDNGVAQLERICVAKEYRGQGYASTIIEAIINDAQKGQCKSIFAYVMEETYGLYERFGFDKLNEHYTFAGVPHCKIERPL